MLIEDVPECLYCGSYDMRATGCSDQKVKRPVGKELDDDWGYGGERSFASLNVIRWGWDESESVGRIRDGEIVHLVVHNDAGLWDHNTIAEIDVDRTGKRNCQA